jgi:AraC-like DNA-binding protein
MLCRSKLESGVELPRHVHPLAYAAIVVQGGYREIGDGGAWRVTQGTVILHSPFEAHSNVANADGAIIINLPISSTSCPAAFHVADFDRLVRVASTDPHQAEALMVPVQTIPSLCEDWEDELAMMLRGYSERSIGTFAQQFGLAPETVSRGFARRYGVPPARYRVAARVRRACRKIISTDEPFTRIAHDCGFSDHSHMSRAVSRLTGKSPTAWRKVNLVQDAHDR